MYNYKFYKVLDRCRDIIVNRHAGEKCLRYLLYKMNNKGIKQQYSRSSCVINCQELYLSFC